jgi:thioredoxin-dependent peroxiredoxin
MTIPHPRRYIMTNRLVTFTLTAMLCAFVLGSKVSGEEKPVTPEVGSLAPSFDGTADDGKPWKSSDFVGKKIVVVYFYPADMTGGCTKQACGFRDDMKVLTDGGVEVIGISGDSVKNHQFFKEYHKLNFTLLADEKGEIAKKFGVTVGKGGVAQPKDKDGNFLKDKDGNPVELKTDVRAARWTFIIGKDGKIAYKDDKVNAEKDSKKILEAIEKLK